MSSLKDKIDAGLDAAMAIPEMKRRQDKEEAILLIRGALQGAQRTTLDLEAQNQELKTQNALLREQISDPGKYVVRDGIAWEKDKRDGSATGERMCANCLIGKGDKRFLLMRRLGVFKCPECRMEFKPLGRGAPPTSG